MPWVYYTRDQWEKVPLLIEYLVEITNTRGKLIFQIRCNYTQGDYHIPCIFNVDSIKTPSSSVTFFSFFLSRIRMETYCNTEYCHVPCHGHRWALPELRTHPFIHRGINGHHDVLHIAISFLLASPRETPGFPAPEGLPFRDHRHSFNSRMCWYILFRPGILEPF